MLKNAYLPAKVGADTAENERILPQICQKNLATTLLLGAADVPGPAGAEGTSARPAPGDSSTVPAEFPTVW